METDVRRKVDLGSDRGAKQVLRAACNGDGARLAELLDAGGDPNGRDVRGWNGLHWAVQDGHDEVVALLAEAGADLEAVDGSGLTALQRAVAWGREEAVGILLEAGARPVSRPEVWDGEWPFVPQGCACSAAVEESALREESSGEVRPSRRRVGP